MTAPAYHLRPNKAADRYVLMEAIGRLAGPRGKGLRGYTYYGLGGPYLEDFRLMYEFYPDMRMVSIENNEETFKRQKFHRPRRSIKLVNESLSSFVTGYSSNNKKSIFWLDYTKLERSCFTVFQSVLVEVAYGSMIKITLPSNPNYFRIPSKRHLNNRGKKFLRDCKEPFMDPGRDDLPDTVEDFAYFLQGMVKMAAQDVLRTEAKDKKFVPVSSFYYSDGTPMFTLTGVACRGDDRDKLKKTFKDWEFANLEWKPPRQINVPTLSTKERLHLQPMLPTTKPETVLYRRLGYSITEDSKEAEEALKQYATFHRYAPYFLKGVP